MPCLVLDAMGVIFQSADDVAELLVPFISEKSASCNEADIQSAYLDVSLGNISPDEFWNQVGVPASRENEFLSQQALSSCLTGAETPKFRSGVCRMMSVAGRRNFVRA